MWWYEPGFTLRSSRSACVSHVSAHGQEEGTDHDCFLSKNRGCEKVGTAIRQL